MRRRLADLIGLREGEGGRTARLVAFLFLVMLAIVLLKAAQRGIFLAAYPRERIPDAFMLSAACLAGASFLAAALAPRLGPIRLALAILVAAALLLPAGRVLLVDGHRGVAMGLYVLVEATAGLLLVQAWQVVAEALDVRSAKRLLPLAGVGAGLAWVVGGFAVGGVARLVGAPGLLLVAPALLLAAAALAAVIGARDVPRRPPAPRAASSLLGGVGDGLRYVWIEPLLRLVAIISIVDLLVEQVVDFQLFAMAQARWAEPERIAAFMGQLYGATGIVTVVAPLLVSGRLLSRFGSTRCLLAAPVWVLAGSVVFWALPSLAVVTAVCAGDRILKQSLSSPGRAQMQTHIPAARRTQASALLRGVLAPLAYLGGGAALKLLPAEGSVRWLAVATVALTATLLLVGARYLRPAYLAALRRSLGERRLHLDDETGLASLDQEQCSTLAAEVRSTDERRAAFAVSLLAGGEASVARPLLHEACRHPAAEVRAAAALALAGFDDADDVAVLHETLERASEDVVEQACLQALARLAEGPVGDAVRRRADDADPRVAALARASLARAEASGFGSLAWAGRRGLAPTAALLAGGAAAQAAVTELAAGETIVPDSRAGQLLDMLRSPREPERAAAAWAMGEVRPEHPGLRRAFARLLDDPAQAVRLAALRAAGRLGDRALVARVVQALADRATAPAAFDALAQLDDEAVPAVEEALAGAAPQVIARAAAGLAPGRGANGDALLLRLVEHDHRVIRYRAARALSARRHWPGWQPPPPARLRAAVTAELEAGFRYWAIVAALTGGDEDAALAPELAFLVGELRARIRQTERRLLALLALAADPAVIDLVATRLRHADAREIAHAIELLEHELEPALAARVIPFLEPRPLRLRLEAAPPAPTVTDPLAALVALGDPYLRRAALLAFGQRLAAEHPAVFEEDRAMLPLVERIYFLRSVPLFHELSGEDLRQVAEIAGRRLLPAGGVVFKKGEAGDALFIVASGRVQVVDGGRALATLGQHEWFGELAVLDGEARSADAVCAEDSELLSLARADLEELIERRPEIARQIIRVLTRRLRDANLRLAGAA